MRAGLLADTFLEAHHVQHLKKRYIDFEMTDEQAAQVAQLKNGTGADSGRRPVR